MYAVSMSIESYIVVCHDSRFTLCNLHVLLQLELQGVLLEEGTDATADPAFLLEVMEINESLAETRSQDEVNAIGQSVRGV